MQMTLSQLDFSESWTLFLDRDGVINKKINKVTSVFRI